MAATALATEQQSTRRSYYRSQLYTAYIGINPLVTAAHPIFSIIERVKLSGQKTDPSQYFPNLEHEFKAFEARAYSADYDEETIFISRYLLSATLDELLIENQSFKLFKQLMPPKKSATTPDQQFFEILDRIIDKPDHYLDLLELIYFCLSLGFQGKYRNEEHEKLQEITQLLYDTITPHRNKNNKPLFSPSPQPEVKANPFWIRAWLSIIILALVLGFFISNYSLDNKAKSLVLQTAATTEHNHDG